MRHITCCLITLAVCLPTVAPAAERPNIILCMADDQGWGDVAYNGHPAIKTPVLDEMSRTGLRFDRFYAAAPVCSPTRGSVLTGRHPNRFGCFSWGHSLRPHEVTIAEMLHAAGYATGHFGKWHLGSVRAESPASPGQSGFDEWFSAANFYENDPLFSHNGKVARHEGESSLVTMNLALDFIRKQSQEKKPFLAVIWFGSPHTPHIAGEKERALYPDQKPNMANYLGEITGIDTAMGELRQSLRELGIADNTLLWYTSDNGAQGPGSTGGLRGKKGSLWEGGVRVPTIIEWPSVVTSPRSTDVVGSTVDIFPTLLDLLDLLDLEPADDRPLDGVSLRPLIEGKPFERDKGLGFWVHPTGGIPRKSEAMLAAMLKEQTDGSPPSEDVTKEGTTWEPLPTEGPFPGHASWREGAWKLHQIPQPKQAGKVTYELYNLADDARESRDVVAAEPERAARMRAALEAWQRSVVQSHNGEDYSTASAK